MTAELTYPPGDGVTVSGEKVTLTPEGCPLEVKVTGYEYSLMEVMVTTAEAEPPGETVKLEGDLEILKSPGAGAEVTCKVKG